MFEHGRSSLDGNNIMWRWRIGATTLAACSPSLKPSVQHVQQQSAANHRLAMPGRIRKKNKSIKTITYIDTWRKSVIAQSGAGAAYFLSPSRSGR
jgi:hypothetical protein